MESSYLKMHKKFALIKEHPHHLSKLSDKLNWDPAEAHQWKTIADQIYFPKHPD